MVAVRRAHAGRHHESGHEWPHDGAVLDLEPGLASRLLAEPAIKMYIEVEPGETVDLDDDGDAPFRPHSLPSEADPESRAPSTSARRPEPKTDGRTGGGRGPDRP